MAGKKSNSGINALSLSSADFFSRSPLISTKHPMKEASPRVSTSSTTDKPDTATTASSHGSGAARSPAHGPSDQFIQDFNSFKSSAAPSRILFYEKSSWVDFPRKVFDELSAAFIAGKVVFELSVDGNNYLFDFIRSIQIDLSTRATNSIAWIDVNGRCFFPKSSINKVVDEFSDETGPRFPGAELLREEDKFYKVVERLFLNGMRRFVPNVSVTSVHKCTYLGPAEILRVRAFQMMMGVTKAERGDANVKFGWYGASPEAIAAVVKHGFGRPNGGVLGLEGRGVGVNLSPPHFPYGSSLLSEADESGEKHLVLCRVIMGNSEQIEAGAVQCHPSSDEFDSGVDDLMNPKWYMVWIKHMNTHILPEYIVSFKTSSHQRASVSSTRGNFMAARLCFQKLLSEMGRSLPSSTMQALEILYSKYKAGKMSKDALIRYLRSVAGDKLLASSIKRIRGY